MLHAKYLRLCCCWSCNGFSDEFTCCSTNIHNGETQDRNQLIFLKISGSIARFPPSGCGPPETYLWDVVSAFVENVGIRSPMFEL